nr:16S rRNA (guanine(966)-N(2))-methyltransferase RsmD [Desulfobulbaceae bacterium]
MRVIAGSARGRRLFSPEGNSKKHAIRPTSDRCRESVFNILGNERVKGCRVLDLFAGTGALGIEALSRGAGETVFVDSGTESLTLIKRNLQAIGFLSYQLFKRDITKGLFFLGKRTAEPVNGEQVGFDLVFLDPPYQKNYCNQVLTELCDNGLVNLGGVVVCEEYRACELPEQSGILTVYDKRVYGDTGFWFYTRKA